MVTLKDKTIITILRLDCLPNWPYDILFFRLMMNSLIRFLVLLRVERKKEQTLLVEVSALERMAIMLNLQCLPMSQRT